MPNKNIIITILLLVLVFLVNFNILELFKKSYKEPFQDTVDLRGQLVSPYNLNNRDYDTIGDIVMGRLDENDSLHEKIAKEVNMSKLAQFLDEGDKGDKGSKGMTGEQGPIGIVEDTQGNIQVKGDTGDRGPEGPAGPKGSLGSTGAIGERGPKGSPGQNGSPGQRGSTGEKGDRGAPGAASSASGQSISIDNLIQKGMILAWSGSIDTIPQGWALCDGTNGTPNLSGRFILGAGRQKDNSGDQMRKHEGSTENATNRQVDDMGGWEEHKLLEGEMPSHNHEAKIGCTGNTNGGCGGGRFVGGNVISTYNGFSTYIKHLDSNKGENQPHNNMPPYYVLAFIMKVSNTEALNAAIQSGSSYEHISDSNNLVKLSKKTIIQDDRVGPSTAAHGGLVAFQAHPQLMIKRETYPGDSHQSINNMALKMGMFSDAKGFIQVEGTNVGARPLCLQSYAGNVGIGTTNPTEKLVVGGDGSKICIGNECLDSEQISFIKNLYANHKSGDLKFGKRAIQFGNNRWRIGESSSDGGHFSVSHKGRGTTSQIYRIDGTLHGGNSRTDYPVINSLFHY